MEFKGFGRRIVSDKREVMNAIIEHKKKIPPIRMIVHKTVKRQITTCCQVMLTHRRGDPE